jgi:hypothetical protein
MEKVLIAKPKRRKKDGKIFKGLSLSEQNVEAIKKEIQKERRSFSSQVDYIIDFWVKHKDK